MNYIYAQIDENNVCISVSQLSGEVSAINLIPLDSYDESILNKKYDSGEWVELPREPVPAEPYQPTNAEVAQQISEMYAKLIIAGVI